MPVFEIEIGGKQFEVEAPDQGAALSAVQGMGGQGAPLPPGRPQQGVMDKLTGKGGERYQTWPERLARSIGGAVKSGATFPGDVYQGKDSPDNVGRAVDTATLGMPINPMVRSGDLAVAGAGTAFNRKPWYGQGYKQDAPSAEQLKQTGGSQIERSADMGVEFRPEAVQNLGAQLESILQSKGANDLVAPETFGILSRLRQPPEGAVSSSFRNVQNLREQLNAAAGSVDAREKRAANLAIAELDKWLAGNHSPSALAGATTPEAAAEASALYKTGRGNYAASKRSDDVTGRAEAAELRAAATHSGHNIGNQTRQRFIDILTNDAKARGYSDPALERIEGLVRGSKTANAARHVGNYFGGGGGMGQNVATGIGAALGGVGGMVAGGGSPAALGVGAAAGATIPAMAGSSARALANALTQREARKIDELVRKESPLAKDMPKNAKYQTAQDAIVRALLQMQLQQQQ